MTFEPKRLCFSCLVEFNKCGYCTKADETCFYLHRDLGFKICAQCSERQIRHERNIEFIKTRTGRSAEAVYASYVDHVGNTTATIKEF